MHGRSTTSCPNALTSSPYLYALFLIFFFNDTATTEIYTLSLHDALPISALPVIARVLMDLNIYRTNVGMVTIGAAFGDNLVGAIIFAIILGMVGGGPLSTSKIAATVVMALGFTAAMLTVVRWCVHRVLPWIEDHTRRSNGVLAFALSLTLIGAALSEWLGIHAVLGAFLVGVVVGDSSHFREQTRSTILGFVSAFFAPLFFAAIGLGV